MHLLVITNDRSGSAGAVDPAAVLVERGCVVTTATIAEAARWRGEVPHGKLRSIQRVVVAGGDGSVGCAAALALALDVPLGVVPAGTANDFVRAMELPEDPERACVLAATGDRFRDVDVAEIEGQPFVNVASLGLAPIAAETAEPLKKRLGAIAYPVGALVSAIRTRPMPMVAEVDGEPVWAGRAWQAMVASTGAFGGWASTGTTRQGDGALDLVIVPGGRSGRELMFDAHALVRGELAQREGVFHARGAQIEITTRRAQKVEVDGELTKLDTRTLDARVGDRPVRVVVG